MLVVAVPVSISPALAKSIMPVMVISVFAFGMVCVALNAAPVGVPKQVPQYVFLLSFTALNRSLTVSPATDDFTFIEYMNLVSDDIFLTHPSDRIKYCCLIFFFCIHPSAIIGAYELLGTFIFTDLGINGLTVA